MVRFNIHTSSGRMIFWRLHESVLNRTVNDAQRSELPTVRQINAVINAPTRKIAKFTNNVAETRDSLQRALMYLKKIEEGR